MAEENKVQLLKYMPFMSVIDTSFWHKFCDLKLEIDMLTENERPIWGYYNKFSSCSFLCVDCSSFNNDYEGQPNNMPGYGFHVNKNTLESFKNCDKQSLIEHFGHFVKEAIVSKKALDNPSMLVAFVILTFADLKKYHFYYWFAFPASVNIVSILAAPIVKMSTLFSNQEIENIFKMHSSLPHAQQGFFGILVKEENINLCTLKEFVSHKNAEQTNTKLYIAFVDPSNMENHPGWPLRNLLTLLAYFCPTLISGPEIIQVICLRNIDSSIVLTLQLSETVGDQEKFVGWEKNERSKFGPKFVSLSDSMDPVKLAERCVDLNLKLMKWRLVPDLDLTSIKSTKCLLLGAGTLGCGVARSLLAWGVGKITFVDCGKVSYSNPVRQSLFTFEDCKNGGRFKAKAAAESLVQIYPGIETSGIVLAIPMPGHGLSDADNVSKLEELIRAHDVIFFLTDSRESRWLPTLIAASQEKIAITAALGFDTYLVLRHGVSERNSKQARLGCYFCNDVTAPGNSLTDRTLDQQCTVTRPAVSNMAAALAVEIMVGILQHKSRGAVDCTETTCLGSIPHSIRGFLSSFNCILPSTPAFPQCIACSPKVINEYEEKGQEFLKKVFENATYLEDLTGLTEMHKATESAEIWALSEEEDISSD